MLVCKVFPIFPTTQNSINVKKSDCESFYDYLLYYFILLYLLSITYKIQKK